MDEGNKNSVQDLVNAVLPPNGGTTGGMIGGWAGTYRTYYPNVCPGCGRCRDCGQVQPYQPVNPLTQPVTIPPPNPWGQPYVFNNVNLPRTATGFGLTLPLQTNESAARDS